MVQIVISPRSPASVNLGLSEKHIKFEKNLPHSFDKSADVLLVNIKTMKKIFSNYMRFSESPIFTRADWSAIWRYFVATTLLRLGMIMDVPKLGWGTKVYVQNQSGPSNGILHRFCLPSPVRIMTQVPWFMYQNRLGPSGGIYYPNFVPCFVVLYLNWI